MAANDNRRTETRDTFALALAGLASQENADINEILRAAAAHAPPTSDPQNHALFAEDLKVARDYAKAHQEASETIEALVSSGVPREEARERVSDAVPAYAEVENALVAVRAANQLVTNSTVIDAEAAATTLGSNIANAYSTNDGIAQEGTLLGNSAVAIEFIEGMHTPEPAPIAVAPIQAEPEIVAQPAPIAAAPEIVAAPAPVVAEPEIVAAPIETNAGLISQLMQDRIDAGQTPAEAAAGVVLARADSHKYVAHIDKDELASIAQKVQASIEYELGIEHSGLSVTAEQMVAMQKDDISSEHALSNLNLHTSTTEARLATDPDQAAAAAILFNASDDQGMLMRIADSEGLVVLNDFTGDGIKINSNGDKTIDKDDITINITDSSLQNTVQNALIGAEQLDALTAAAEEMGLKEINLNVGPNGVANPSNPELAKLAAELREEAAAMTILEIETAKIQAITQDMMAQGGQDTQQLLGNAVGEYQRGNDDPNKLSAEETMGIVQATFRDQVAQQAITSEDIDIIFEDSSEVSVGARLAENTNPNQNAENNQFIRIVEEGRKDLIGTEEEMVVLQENFGDGSKPMTITVADVDGDGKDEVLTINLNESGGIENGETVVSMENLQSHIAEALKGGVTEITLNEDSNGVVSAPINTGISQQNDGVQR